MPSTFDPFAKRYADVVNDSVSFSGKSVDYFLGVKAALLQELLTPISSPVRLLDVGCGTGILHGMLSKTRLELHAVDVSKASLEEAKQHNPDVHYAHYDGLRIPYDDDSFDAVFASCVLHHVPPEQWKSFTAEMARVVRPNGFVVLFEHNPYNPLTQWVVKSCELDEDAVLIRPGASRRLMEGARLNAVRSRFFLFTPFSAAPFRFLEKILGWLPLGAQYMTWGRVA